MAAAPRQQGTKHAPEKHAPERSRNLGRQRSGFTFDRAAGSPDTTKGALYKQYNATVLGPCAAAGVQQWGAAGGGAGGTS